MPLHSSAHPARIVAILTLAVSLLISCSQPTDVLPLIPENSPEPAAIESTNTPEDVQFNGEDDGTIYLSIEENGYAHLFIIQPQGLPLTRITTGQWNRANISARSFWR